MSGMKKSSVLSVIFHIASVAASKIFAKLVKGKDIGLNKCIDTRENALEKRVIKMVFGAPKQ